MIFQELHGDGIRAERIAAICVERRLISVLFDHARHAAHLASDGVQALEQRLPVGLVAAIHTTGVRGRRSPSARASPP